jgi:peptidoglycan/LPS O-acetylase OafA/YrhL
LKLLANLARVTTPGRAFIPQIDGLRFIAIMAVIAYHVRAICSFHLHASPDGTAIEGDPVNDVFSTGHLGVQLFFAISGFILSLPFARWWLGGEKPVSLRGYYLRRVTRIEPPYVIHLAFLSLLCVLVLRYQPLQQHFFQHSNWLDYSSKHILASLFYSNGFIFGSHPYPNIVLWSLEVEVQFYILAPLLARVFKIDRVWLRRGLMVAGIGLLPLAAGPVSHWLGNPYLGIFSLLANLQYFLIGFLLADWQVTAKAPASRNLLWDLFFLLSGVILVVFRNSAWMGFALPVIIGVCSVAAFKGTLTFRALGNPWITTIGGMCYTIYMYHWLMISMLIRPFIHLQTHHLWLDLLIYFVLMSLLILPVCAILFAVFERPFMRRDWPERFRQKFLGMSQSEEITTGSTTPP